ncbi:MAG TPA: lysophospholipase [Gallionella sp.]|nr:lysophospholipase [Gallionella sp.]
MMRISWDLFDPGLGMMSDMPDLCRVSAVLLMMAALTGCAAPRLQPGLPEDRVPVLHETNALMPDGYVLPLSVWKPEGEVRAVVLALHGFNDYRHAFADAGVQLAASGIATYAYDQRGFGETEWRGMWAGTRRMVLDMETMAALIHARYPGVPLYLMGESMGGAVLLASLSRNPGPQDVSGMVLVAPAVWGRETMNPFERLLLWLGAHTIPSHEVSGEGLHIKPSDNVEMLRALGRDPLVIKKTRIDTLSGLTDLMDEAAASVPRLRGQVLIQIGAHDEVIPKRPTCRMLALLADRAEHRPRVVFYPQGYHMLTRDLRADIVLRDIARWISDAGHAPLSDESPVDASATAAEFCGGDRE